MPTETSPGQEAENNGAQREDEPIPTASEDKVLDETARLAREGRKELESDPKEPKSS
ncbi:MAG: hypothetical protein JWQ76_4235 [Ramlibacter sp.]|nr:hypothetical protein [Ramlibacter sp.]